MEVSHVMAVDVRSDETDRQSTMNLSSFSCLDFENELERLGVTMLGKADLRLAQEMFSLLHLFSRVMQLPYAFEMLNSLTSGVEIPQWATPSLKEAFHESRVTANQKFDCFERVLTSIFLFHKAFPEQTSSDTTSNVCVTNPPPSCREPLDGKISKNQPLEICPLSDCCIFDALDSKLSGSNNVVARGVLWQSLKNEDATSTTMKPQITAIKIVSRSHEEKFSLRRQLDEIRISLFVDHPSIVKTLQVHNFLDMLFVSMDYANGGDLVSLIRRKGNLIEGNAAHIFYQLLMGLFYLHQNDITHRDIKPENILLHSTGNSLCWNAILADLGAATFLSPHTTLNETLGTVSYAAPEVLQGISYEGSAVDVWSLGVTLYASVYGEVPWVVNNLSAAAAHQVITHNELRLPEVTTNGYPISWECRHLLLFMIKIDPKERIPLRDIIRHPFMTKHLLGDSPPEQTKISPTAFFVKSPPIKRLDAPPPSHNNADGYFLSQQQKVVAANQQQQQRYHQPTISEQIKLGELRIEQKNRNMYRHTNIIPQLPPLEEVMCQPEVYYTQRRRPHSSGGETMSTEEGSSSSLEELQNQTTHHNRGGFRQSSNNNNAKIQGLRLLYDDQSHNKKPIEKFFCYPRRSVQKTLQQQQQLSASKSLLQTSPILPSLETLQQGQQQRQQQYQIAPQQLRLGYHHQLCDPFHATTTTTTISRPPSETTMPRNHLENIGARMNRRSTLERFQPNPYQMMQPNHFQDQLNENRPQQSTPYSSYQQYYTTHGSILKEEPLQEVPSPTKKKTAKDASSSSDNNLAHKFFGWFHNKKDYGLLPFVTPIINRDPKPFFHHYPPRSILPGHQQQQQQKPPLHHQKPSEINIAPFQQTNPQQQQLGLQASISICPGELDRKQPETDKNAFPISRDEQLCISNAYNLQPPFLRQEGSPYYYPRQVNMMCCSPPTRLHNNRNTLQYTGTYNSNTLLNCIQPPRGVPDDMKYYEDVFRKTPSSSQQQRQQTCCQASSVRSSSGPFNDVV